WIACDSRLDAPAHHPIRRSIAIKKGATLSPLFVAAPMASIRDAYLRSLPTRLLARPAEIQRHGIGSGAYAQRRGSVAECRRRECVSDRATLSRRERG